MKAWRLAGLLIAVALRSWPSEALAQGAASTITGVVRDTSGAVLPGVTVQSGGAPATSHSGGSVNLDTPLKTTIVIQAFVNDL